MIHLLKLFNNPLTKMVVNKATDHFKHKAEKKKVIRAAEIEAAKDVDININELTNTFNQIPGQYHEILTYKAIAMGYKDPRNMNIEAAQYFDIEYEKGVKEGKKFSKSNYQSTGTIKPQEF